ncbi:hypothetical protein FISHEDRAFT_40434 [Fistulina hepatica ATCC 64428]|uniref:DNA/RNA-binding domain-containing protein n=1 Tax=Fistulina hepatica ATCC 64428 TaxID=1128425 RepID=A0A0D7AES2_9AGAR|nr:hypothetical protein FISHEDRAFT_40434 [Fistulina hepatica ATCC 64428]
MNTSYLFISCYKQKIHALDRVQQRGAQDPANRQRQGQAQGQGQSHGPVEHRKLVQRFRQFLADEEKFWGKFIARFRRSFALTEANAALLTLEIISVEDVVGDATDGPTEDHGRNHFQFPAEDTSVDLTPTTDADRRSRMVILSKAMTCLGDIARYREQYNESGGRPKAGHEDHPPSAKKNAGRGKRGGPELRRRNYERAQQCYEQARRLVPTEGNPSHQMAIIATYQKDVFSALLHNYRALCVLQPYDTAAENMGVILSKAMDQWRRSRRDDTADPPPHIQVERFKESVVVLHAMWRDKVDTRKHASAIYKNYRSLILQRNLPADTINAVVILSQGALWKHRMFEDPKPRRREEKQTRIFMHLLDVHRALLEVGIEELKEPLPSDMPSNDLAQKITAAFRRTLAALRIASKWLIANYDYVAHGMEKDRTRANEKGRTSTTPLVRFWTSYADFMRTLQRSFPVGNLPNLSAPLGEDLDLQGFLPLKQTLLAREPASADSASSDNQGADGLSGEHPNVVQLMRISDLFSDANTIVAMEDSPIALYGNQFMVKGVEVATGQQQSSPSSAAIVVSSVLSSEVADEDAMTELTDDPVAEAFKHLEDGEDEILWDPRYLEFQDQGTSIND